MIRRAAANVALAVAVALAALAAGADPGRAATATPHPQWGVYTGAGAKGVAGATSFAAFSGAPVGRVVDFLQQSSWTEMIRNEWMISPYTGTGYQLMLSVPMLPDTAGTSLEACARGDYDSYWATIASGLVSDGLPTTEIRPGWEFNGNWYKWSAAGHISGYIGCFQHLVTAMRGVQGGHFTFTWNPNLGAGAFPAEQAWPGAQYVDDISLDVYDTSWTSYPVPSGASVSAAQASAWNWIKKGDHGLNFWSAFAAAQSKPMGFAEWGLAWRSDGHGGGDDTVFVDGMFDFMADPTNHVAYGDYFNSATSATLDHQVTPTTRFPLAAAEMKLRMNGGSASPALTTTPRATSAPRVISGPTPSPRATSTPRPSTSPVPSPTATGGRVAAGRPAHLDGSVGAGVGSLMRLATIESTATSSTN